MADEKISMPASQGGLVRYYSEYKSKIQIKPTHVIMLAVAIIVFELLLRLFKS